MRRRKTKITDRLLALLLSIMMVVALFPTNLFPVMAEEDGDVGLFTLTVTDVADETKFIKDVKVTLSSKDDKWDKDLVDTTDDNGVVSFSTADIEKAITDGVGTVEYKAVVPGYYAVIGEIAIDGNLEINTPVQMKAIAEESVEISVQDAEDDNKLKDAEILLKVKKDDAELKKLYAVTDENGVAKFDKDAFSQVLNDEEAKVVEYTVSLAGYESKTILAENIVSVDDLQNIESVKLDKMPPDMLEIIVQDEESNVIDGADVILNASGGSWALNLNEETDGNGVVSFSKEDIIQTLVEYGLREGTIKCIVKHDEYFTKVVEFSFDSAETLLDQTISMKKVESGNSFQINIVDGEGQAVEGAEVELSAMEDAEWTLNLYAISGTNGVANFDKDAIANALAENNLSTGNVVYTVKIAGYETATGEVSTDTLDDMHDVNIRVESFKVAVKKENGDQPIVNATVVLSSKDVEWDMTVQTGLDGIARFDKDTIAEAIDGEKLISGIVVYTVYMDEKAVATGEVQVSSNDLIKTVDVVIATHTVSVEVDDLASVTLNHSNNLNIEVNHAADEVGKVALEIVPKGDAYIKEVFISKLVDGVELKTPLDLDIEKGESYINDEINVDANITIKIVMGNRYKVNFNANLYDEETKIGAIKLGETELSVGNQSVLVDENTSTKLIVSVPENVSYVISSIKIGEDEYDITNNKYLEIDINNVDEDIDVEVEFVRLYTVTITHDDNGNVKTTPVITDGGSVEVKQDETFSVVATPKDNYRVSQVLINGSLDNSVTGENNSSYNNEFTVNSDYTIVITFSLNQYVVTKEEYDSGKIVLNNDENANNIAVDYDSTCDISIRPNNGFVVSSVTVNGTIYTNYEDDPTYERGVKFTLNKFTRDTTISVEFIPIPIIDEDWANLIDFTGMVRRNGKTLIYAKDAQIKFSVNNKKGIALYSKDWKWNKINSDSPVVQFSYSTEHKSIFDIGTIYLIPYKGHWQQVGSVSTDSPLEIIIDNRIEGIKFEYSQDSANANGYYNDDFNVYINNVEDDYSGLQSVEYFVTNTKIEEEADQYEKIYEDLFVNHQSGLQKGIIYQHSTDPVDKIDPTYITIDTEINNSDYVSVWFKIADRAGNVKYVRTTGYYKVNTTAPKLESVDIDETAHILGAKDRYYSGQTSVEIVILDRPTTFSLENVIKGITIYKDGEKLSYETKLAMISGLEKPETEKSVVTITFTEDGKYSWIINYTNKADCDIDKTNAKNTYEITVDNTEDDDFLLVVDNVDPEGNIKLNMSNTWDNLFATLTFGFWTKYDVTVSAEINDNISADTSCEVLYYMLEGDELLSSFEELSSVEDLDELYSQGKFKADTITINKESKFVIYARIKDEAGRVAYIRSDGAIIDKVEKGFIEITPEDYSEDKIYNSDVIVNVSVNELVDGFTIYSGIKTIDYEITSNGVLTQKGNLFTFDKKQPTYDELVQIWSSDENNRIIVDAEKNNSDSVVVKVIVKDNSENEYNKECSLKINKDKVKATLKMDKEANTDIDNHGYFKATDRTATITITERESVFDAVAATKGIKILVNGEENPDAYTISDWTLTVKENNSDVVTFTATVTFKGNAEFDWSFSYTNKAGNALNINDSECFKVEGDTPYLFTLDTEKPTGFVKVNDKEWDDILYDILHVLTFGLIDEKYDVTAEGTDAFSPVVIEYFMSEDTSMLTEKELQDLYTANNSPFKKYSAFSVTEESKYVIYVRISDYAGNYTYIASNGYIIDKTGCEISITPVTSKDVYSATDDVKFNVKVTDPGKYSGISYVKYWITNNGKTTQEGVLKESTLVENPTYDQLESTFSDVITVDKTKNNSNDVVIHVSAIDNAGNEGEVKEQKVSIDTDKPAISISFNNGKDNNGNGYFKGQRVATVDIIERNFDETEARKGINIKATDAQGNDVPGAYSISGWTHDNDNNKHTVVITFAKDANYTWSIEYTDEAGNKNSTPTTSVKDPDVNGSSVVAYKFTVDSKAPTGLVNVLSSEGKKLTSKELRTNFTFGFISNSKITVSGTFEDDTTIDSLKAEYYKVKVSSPSEVIKPLTETQLKDITNWTTLITKTQTANDKKEFTFGDIVVNKDEQFVVYIKLTDLAGNVTYLSTNGLIVDSKAPVGETLAPEISTTQPKPSNGVYKDDVVVDIKVTDPLTGGTYSGLESVTYEVLNMGEVTQSGELFKFGIDNPSQSQLKQTWTGKIEVDSDKNNSNDVKVVIVATDRAGNQTTKTISLKIDTTAPTIDIEYNNNNAETSYAGETLFKEDRVATIKVTERNFDGNKVILEITNTDGTMPVLSNWSVFKNGTGNGDDTVYMATLTYSADGDYKFAIKYTDNADNACTDIEYGDSLAPTEFTIDKTLPTIQVTYDNTNVANGLYYNQDRVATVTVTEHNFDASRFELTLTATDNGKVIALPVASQWTSNGDVHRITIPFAQDGHYTIDVAFTDKAGNIANDFAEQNFYIDKTNPTLSISGVVDQSANNAGEVGLVITITDTNVGEFEPNIYAIISTDDDYKTEKYNIGSKQNITNGIKYTVTNLPDDGMYRVECIAKDKAGNIYSEVVLYKADGTSYTEPKTEGDVLLTFSVNREGSVYEVNDITEKLIKDTYVQSISDDIAIVEVNADELVSYEVLLNGRVLVENTDYTVVKEGGNGQWYKYTYLVSKSLFTEDGEYELVISSKDKAYNSAFSDVKGRTITFVVDTTAPVVAVSGLESNGRYNATEHTVTIVPTDDGGSISKVIVGYADKSGNIYEELLRLEGEELTKALEEAEGKLSFVIKEGLDKDIKIMCWDSAFDSEGNSNVYETTFTGVSVSTSQIAMLWANDGIRNGVIISVVVVILGIAALVAIRVVRKKKNR